MRKRYILFTAIVTHVNLVLDTICSKIADLT